MKQASYILFLLVLICAVCTGCASKGKTETPQPPIHQETYSEQSAQMQAEGAYQTPQGGSGSSESGDLPGTAPSERRPEPVTTPLPTDSSARPAASKMLGYRVQVMALSNKEDAVSQAQKAADLLGVPGYVEQAGGLWKVRMGNAKTRQEAETLRDYARNKGFSDAWIVETEISISK